MQDALMSINVPFCVKQCGYCPRTVVEGWDAKRLHAYMEAVKNEVEANASELDVYKRQVWKRTCPGRMRRRCARP